MKLKKLKERIFIRVIRNKEISFVHCIIREKDIQLKPEEIIRQLYSARPIDNYGYPKNALSSNVRLILENKQRLPILSF